jgi:dihydroorotate dehydrogenase electron transfer subunit
MYWGSKPITDLLNIFEQIQGGDIILDPFCGGGNPTVAALIKGARVIACDLNPMAVFLTKVLIRPINLASLKSAFEDVDVMVSCNILEKYTIMCPHCKNVAIIKSLVWVNENVNESRPEAAQIDCRRCGQTFFKLSSSEVKRQLELSQIRPNFWFPRNRIHTTRKPRVVHHYELFTGRNLSMLAELIHAIKKVPSQNLQDALLYVFTAMLYNCSSMQMFSEKELSSSRGWTALRFYIPPKRREVNVWHAFERRFDKLMNCKRELNRLIPGVRITDSAGDFFLKNYEAFIYKADAFDLIRQFGERANFVFLDPPYIDDIDYFGFSEFWGSWLEMHFDFELEWHPKRVKSDERLRKLLMLLSEVTSQSCDICLAFDPKRQGWDGVEFLKDSRYKIKRTGYFYYDNSNKRGNEQIHRYYILEKTKSKKRASLGRFEAPMLAEVNTVQQVFPYLRVINYLYPRSRKSETDPERNKTFYERIRSLAAQLVPQNLYLLLRDLKEDDIAKAISDEATDRRTYHSLCYALLRIILSKDGWKITYLDPAQLEDNVFGLVQQEVNCIEPIEVPEGIALIAQNNKKKILFCFDDQETSFLKRVATEIKNLDNDEFNIICVMIVPDKPRMNNKRRVSKADYWPRGFFMCFPEIRKKCEKLNEEEYLKLCARTSRVNSDSKERSKIMSLTAEVNDNIPVGKEGPNHYKLRFKTPKTKGFNIIPGQFIMTTTAPSTRRHDIARIPKKWDEVKSTFRNEPTSYLKRPFGIHRAFYPHFGKAYLKKLLLPPALASVLHTVFPNEFEIFYKVLPNGVGTRELSKVRKGDSLQIIGPLGKRRNMREIRDQGFEEIHVIGGGVGMAPLIFMVQALRYYSYTVKAFIGIEKFESLKYGLSTDGLDPTFSVEPRDAIIYIDDLQYTGIDLSDIYVSSTTSEDVTIIPRENFYKGFVSEQYKNYLDNHPPKKRIAAFACGPMGMMKALVPITKKYGVQLKVLMEKRMACGIGVCLSCVCETRNGQTKYSRVCTDGPIFDADEISWKNVH